MSKDLHTTPKTPILSGKKRKLDYQILCTYGLPRRRTDRSYCKKIQKMTTKQRSLVKTPRRFRTCLASRQQMLPDLCLHIGTSYALWACVQCMGNHVLRRNKYQCLGIISGTALACALYICIHTPGITRGFKTKEKHQEHLRPP